MRYSKAILNYASSVDAVVGKKMIPGKKGLIGISVFCLMLLQSKYIFEEKERLDSLLQLEKTHVLLSVFHRTHRVHNIPLHEFLTQERRF